MGSLNGDILVKRNGRCTSKVSVYNYPEHLNPFYEDDQHKRLRFWTLKKYKDQGRSNSISFSNLKDIWGFKSFRLNKKSSTLGINKTSESPPLLRRQLQQNGPNTTNYNGSALYGDNFQRNTISRCSFQNLLKQDRMGFNRNDNYRSTIQVGDFNRMQHIRQQPPSASVNRYVYRGSMTPQPLRNVDKVDQYNNSNNNNNNNIPQKGSSRLSVINTNPFDIDYESGNNNTNDSINVRNVNETIIAKKSTPYKKRRAPPPPPSVVSVSASVGTLKTFAESSQNVNMDAVNHMNSNELCIAEGTDLANLTAEIEHFVETKNNANIERDKIQRNMATVRSSISDTQPTLLLKNSPTNVSQVSTNSTSTSNITTESYYDNVKPNESSYENKKTNNGAVDKDKDNVEKIVPVKATLLEKELLTKEALSQITTNSDISGNKSLTGVMPPEEKQANNSCCFLLEDIEKPTKIKRKSKVDVEQKQQNNKISGPQFTSFKPQHNNEVQIDTQITAKTSFTLTSPPSKRKDNPNKENTRQLNEINYEQHNNQNKVSSNLNASKSIEGERPRFAEIHKPTRNKINQKLINTNREELIVPVKHGLSENSYKAQKVTEGTRANNPKHNTYDKANASFIQNNRHTLQIFEPSLGNGDDTNVNKGNATLEACDGISYRHMHRETSQEWKQSSLAPLEHNVPPEKRKSVKDIIESINRSQRILNASANKDFPVWPDRAVIDDNCVNQQIISHTPIVDDKRSNLIVSENLKMLDESEQKLKVIMDEIESSIKNQQTNLMPTLKNNATNFELSSMIKTSKIQTKDDQQKIDNNDIIQKGSVIKDRDYDSRESSPISSNLDWNPLPKPKRIKPIKEEIP